jgi:hypothetical protein
VGPATTHWRDSTIGNETQASGTLPDTREAAIREGVEAIRERELDP